MRGKKRRTDFTLAIDPGIRTMGACLFDGETPVAAWYTELKKFPGDRPAGIAELVQRMEVWLDRRPFIGIDRVACEMPEHFGSAVGMAAAGRGDTIWLGFCVGFVAGRVADSQPFFAYAVRDWKGNMSKTMTADRIKKRLTKLGIDWRTILSSDMKHDWDACGVGLHSLGLEL